MRSDAWALRCYWLAAALGVIAVVWFCLAPPNRADADSSSGTYGSPNRILFDSVWRGLDGGNDGGFVTGDAGVNTGPLNTQNCDSLAIDLDAQSSGLIVYMGNVLSDGTVHYNADVSASGNAAGEDNWITWGKGPNTSTVSFPNGGPNNNYSATPVYYGAPFGPQVQLYVPPINPTVLYRLIVICHGSGGA